MRMFDAASITPEIVSFYYSDFPRTHDSLATWRIRNRSWRCSACDYICDNMADIDGIALCDDCFRNEMSLL